MAQLDNAADSDSEERGFESLRAGQKESTNLCGWCFLFSFEVNARDSNPERARSVKKNSVGHCFLAKGCAGGYRKAEPLGRQAEKTPKAAVSLRAGQKESTNLCGWCFLDFVFKL